MNATQLQRIIDWFNGYVKDHKTDAGDNLPYVQRKYRHTLRVLSHVREMVPACGTGDDACLLIECAAILHDVGRFAQLRVQSSYDDGKGYDHGTQGAITLEEAGILDDLPEGERSTILETVRFHNRAAIPEDIGPDSRRALEVVRDGDKLDAIRNNLKYLNPAAQHGKALKSGLTWHDTEVSADVLEQVMSRQLVPFKSIRWSNDFILFLCCWIYDLHYPYAFNQLVESGNYDKLLGLLPDTPAVAPAKAQLRGDLDWIAKRSRS